jgi:hypothetical protein
MFGCLTHPMNMFLSASLNVFNYALVFKYSISRFCRLYAEFDTRIVPRPFFPATFQVCFIYQDGAVISMTR